jgi:hypothetical protein
MKDSKPQLKYLIHLPLPAGCLLLLCWLFSSCGGGCDYFDQRSYRYTYMQLLDSTNRFEEIRYPDFDEPYRNLSNMNSLDFQWNLRISKPTTIMYIRTKNRGWDTLVYAMTKKNIVFSEAHGCESEGIRMEITGPDIVSHTFDTFYFRDISTGSYSYTSKYTLFLK